jgi:hypothetical protein
VVSISNGFGISSDVHFSGYTFGFGLLNFHKRPSLYRSLTRIRIYTGQVSLSLS